jgi:hypothetical protein
VTETFALLLLAHVVADFILQPAAMVARKKDPLVILVHSLIVLFTAQAALGQFAALPLLYLALAHLVIDAVKVHLLPAGLAPFLGDQAAHLATLIAVAVLWPDLAATGLWAGQLWLTGVAALVAGLIITTRTGGFAVGFLMQRFTDAELPPGLRDGGKVIGLLERGLIFVLVLAGQPAGIGFLIAAKSILRFETTAKDQKASEYVIIGTLASFGWAMVAAYATLALMNDLAPLGILPVLP